MSTIYRNRTTYMYGILKQVKLQKANEKGYMLRRNVDLFLCVCEFPMIPIKLSERRTHALHFPNCVVYMWIMEEPTGKVILPHRVHTTRRHRLRLLRDTFISKTFICILLFIKYSYSHLGMLTWAVHMITEQRKLTGGKKEEGELTQQRPLFPRLDRCFGENDTGDCRTIYRLKKDGRTQSRDGGNRSVRAALMRKAPWRQEQSQAASLIKHLLPCLNLFEAQKYMKYYTG